MEKSINLTDFEDNFEKLIDEVVREGTHFIITRDGQPIAALVPYGEFERFKELQGEKFLEQYDRLAGEVAEHNRDKTEAQIDKDIQQAIDEVRAEENESANDNDG